MRIFKIGSRNGCCVTRTSEIYHADTNASFEAFEPTDSFWDVVDRSKFSRCPTVAQIEATEHFRDIYNHKPKKEEAKRENKRAKNK